MEIYDDVDDDNDDDGDYDCDDDDDVDDDNDDDDDDDMLIQSRAEHRREALQSLPSQRSTYALVMTTDQPLTILNGIQSHK